MRRLALLVLVFVLLTPVPSALAIPLSACGDGVGQSSCVAGNGTDTLTATATATTPAKKKDPGGKTSGGTSVPQDYVTYDYAPTCTGNSRLDADVLCGAATQTCQPADTGLIRYWPWTVTHDGVTGAVKDVVRDDSTFCLGPDAAGLPPIVVVLATVERDFKSLVVVTGTTQVKPRGTTLVNYPTQFSTQAGEYTLNPFTVLGHRVVLTVHPKQYDWYFGDGQVALDAGPGQAEHSDVTHAYRRTGAVQAHVVITWTGTFTVDGGRPRDVQGTAVTTGPGTGLRVRQARAELVNG